MIETKFKQTEIGLIPNDWVIKTTKEFADITTGSQNTQDHVNNGKYPFYVRSPKVERINNYIFDTEGVVTAGDGVGTGKTFHYVNGKFGLHQRCYLVYNYIGVSAKYFYWIFSQFFYQRIQSMTAKSSVDSVRKEMIANMYIPLPPTITEQQHIAEALSNIDQLIFSLSKIIEKKRLIKQGAMQQLLTGKKRLPGFDGEWKERELGLLVNIQRGSMLKSSEYLFGNVPVIAGGTTPAGFHNVANRRGRTITISASGANAGYISYYKEPIFATDCSTISEGDGYYIDFIYYSLLFNQKEIFRLQTGGAQPHIHPKDIAPLKVAIPCTYDEQVAIANILTTMDNEIESLKEEREKYVHIKEGMMHKLLTGQIRLIKAETRQTALSKTRAANVHFKRCVLAAEIADRLCGEKTFGHVKMEKLIFLTERLCHIDIDSHYHRDAAGPYDNRALRSIDSQMKKQQWFAVTKKDKGYQYQPMEKRGEHKKYFDRYYSDVLPMFDKIINTFKTSSTEQCEIVATIYSAWDDLLHGGRPFSDEDILDEVLNNWHESKRRIERSRWQKALVWMRDNGFVPQTENL